MNVVARDHSGKEALLLWFRKHMRNTRQEAVARVHIIVVHIHKNVMRRIGHGKVSLCSDCHGFVRKYIYNVLHVRDQVLDLILSVVHDNPLNLLCRVRLRNQTILDKRNEGTAITSNGNDGDEGQVLFLGKH